MPFPVEEKYIKEAEYFPDNAIAIAHDSSDNKLVMIHKGDGVLSENIYFWNHKTGEIEESINKMKSKLCLRKSH